MYGPIKAHFEGLGHVVRGEVKGCDIVMTKNDSTAIIEMKTAFSISLVYQLIDRQRAAANVYAAIPRTAFLKNRAKIIHILTKLDCGLITVAMDSPVKAVAVHLAPNSGKERSNPRAKALAKEIAGRTFDGNIGGTMGKKLMTAHRERAIHAACILAAGPNSPAKLVVLGCGKNVGQMLNRNFYGWFEKLGHGLYGLSAAGEAALAEPAFAQEVAYYQKMAEGMLTDVQSQNDTDS